MTAHSLDETMERMRKNWYPLWCVMMKVRADPMLLEEWRDAPPGVPEWRKSRQHAQALVVLGVAMSD